MLPSSSLFPALHFPCFLLNQSPLWCTESPHRCCPVCFIAELLSQILDGTSTLHRGHMLSQPLHNAHFLSSDLYPSLSLSVSLQARRLFSTTVSSKNFTMSNRWWKSLDVGFLFVREGQPCPARPPVQPGFLSYQGSCFHQGHF